LITDARPISAIQKKFFLHPSVTLVLGVLWLRTPLCGIHA
jgi:hypothetical protein